MAGVDDKMPIWMSIYVTSCVNFKKIQRVRYIKHVYVFARVRVCGSIFVLSTLLDSTDIRGNMRIDVQCFFYRCWHIIYIYIYI